MEALSEIVMWIMVLFLLWIGTYSVLCDDKNSNNHGKQKTHS